MKPRCPKCGTEKVVFGETKDGQPYLLDARVPHRFTCPAREGRPKAGKPQKRPVGPLVAHGKPSKSGATEAENVKLEALVREQMKGAT